MRINQAGGEQLLACVLNRNSFLCRLLTCCLSQSNELVVFEKSSTVVDQVLTAADQDPDGIEQNGQGH